jgi:hypothetical protein
MNFGKWIVVAFTVFAGFIATLVTVCVRQDIPLVTKDYYEEELNYQSQIERKENTNRLTETPVISLQDRQIKLSYGSLPRITKGEIRLFRPSDPRLDQRFMIEASSSTFRTFKIINPENGLYKARLTWEQDGKEYFLEKIVVL